MGMGSAWRWVLRPVPSRGADAGEVTLARLEDLGVDGHDILSVIGMVVLPVLAEVMES